MGIDFKTFPEEYKITLYGVYKELQCENDNLVEKSWANQFYNFHNAADRGATWSFDDIIENIGLLAKKQDYWLELDKSLDPNKNYRIGLPDKALYWGIKFLKEFMKEIRKIICEKKRTKSLENYKNYPNAIIVALSSSLMGTLKISNPLAIGLATLIFLSLATATKNAFCNMSDEEVITEIEKSSIGSSNIHKYIELKNEEKENQ